MSGKSQNQQFHRLNKNAMPNQDGWVSVWNEQEKRFDLVDPATLVGGGSTAFNGNRAVKRSPWIGLVPGGETVVEVLENLLYPNVDTAITLTGTLLEYFERNTGIFSVGNKLDINATITANDGLNIRYRLWNNTTNTPVGAWVNFVPGVQPYFTADFTTNVDRDWKIQVEFKYNPGTPGEITKTILTSNTEQHRFIYPYFIGMGGDLVHFTSEQFTTMMGLTKVVAPLSANLVRNLNGNDLRIYIIYPATKGPITSIKDQNGFDVTNQFTALVNDVSAAGMGWGPHSYRIYQSGVTSVNNSNFTFNF